MRILDQKITFKVFKATKFPTNEDECFTVEMVNSVVNSELEQVLRSDTLERALTGKSDSEGEEGEEQLQVLNAPPWKRKLDMPFDSLGLVELKISQERLNHLLKKLPYLSSTHCQIT